MNFSCLPASNPPGRTVLLCEDLLPRHLAVDRRNAGTSCSLNPGTFTLDHLFTCSEHTKYTGGSEVPHLKLGMPGTLFFPPVCPHFRGQVMPIAFVTFSPHPFPFPLILAFGKFDFFQKSLPFVSSHNYLFLWGVHRSLLTLGICITVLDVATALKGAVM